MRLSIYDHVYTPAEAAAYVKSEFDKWARVVREARLRAD